MLKKKSSYGGIAGLNSVEEVEQLCLKAEALDDSVKDLHRQVDTLFAEKKSYEKLIKTEREIRKNLAKEHP